MSSWGNNDNAANAPYWAVNSTIVNGTDVKENASAPTAANVALLYGNTTVDVYTTNATIGLFGVDANESGVDGHTHTGWVLRTVGTGGRAGRVQEEVLVALNTMTGDNEDVVYKDTVITITSQPSDNTIFFGSGNTISFSVAATGTPSATLNYYWQINDGTGWANTSTSANALSGNTSTTVMFDAESDFANTYVVRAIVNANGTGAAQVTSANAAINLFDPA
jgi:hypothetical protein